jgi:hypothetical protein
MMDRFLPECSDGYLPGLPVSPTAFNTTLLKEEKIIRLDMLSSEERKIEMKGKMLYRNIR